MGEGRKKSPEEDTGWCAVLFCKGGWMGFRFCRE